MQKLVSYVLTLCVLNEDHFLGFSAERAMASSTATGGGGGTVGAGGGGGGSTSRKFKLQRESELRVEVGWETPLRLQLMAGTAEVFGTELPPAFWLSFPPAFKFAVSSFACGFCA